jgi:hypothetical protein
MIDQPQESEWRLADDRALEALEQKDGWSLTSNPVEK